MSFLLLTVEDLERIALFLGRHDMQGNPSLPFWHPLRNSLYVESPAQLPLFLNSLLVFNHFAEIVVIRAEERDEQGFVIRGEYRFRYGIIKT